MRLQRESRIYNCGAGFVWLDMSGFSMELAAVEAQSLPPAIAESARSQTLLIVVLVDILFLVALHSAYWLFAGINQPIADLHQFRQTQTAITAYWLANGGPWLAYETPVLGYP